MLRNEGRQLTNPVRKSRFVFGFIAGVLVGCVLGAMSAFWFYYRYNYGVLGGPYASIARDYRTYTNGIMDLSGRPRTPEEIADLRLKLVLSQSIIVAGLYCDMRKTDQAAVRQEAAMVREDSRIRQLIGQLSLKNVQEALDYLSAAGETNAPCRRFRPTMI